MLLDTYEGGLWIGVKVTASTHRTKEAMFFDQRLMLPRCIVLAAVRMKDVIGSGRRKLTARDS